MTRKSQNKAITCFFLFLILSCIPKANAQDQPNFLFILVDDLGWADLGCYGNTFNETPNIDQLAAGGLRFINAYAASPVCSPTRASIQTGVYPARLDFNMIINPHRRPWAKLVPPQNRWNLPQDQPTLAESLGKAGYNSGIFGKWNLGYESPDMPQDRGYVVKVDEPISNHAYKSEIETFKKENTGKSIGNVTEQAARFIEQQSSPFLCFVSYTSVHIPMEAREELVQKYARKKLTQKTDIHPKYAAMVQHVDESVGLLIGVLDELKLKDNTIVFFFSDNGGLIQVYHECGPIIGTNKPLRGEKGTLYEGGIRVPLIVRWPEKIKQGGVSDEMVISNDFFPTLMEFADARAADQEDGISLVSHLLNGTSLKRDHLFWHYPTYHHSTPAAAVRDKRYKLIEFFETGELELYDLQTDIGEMKNLVDKKPEVARIMLDKLRDWRQSLDAGMPNLNPDYDISKAYIWGLRPEKPWMDVQPMPLPMEERCKLLATDGEEIIIKK